MLLTILAAIGGIGVVVATAVIEALGDSRATSGGIAAVLVGAAVLLLRAGAVTAGAETRTARRSRVVPASG